MRGAFLGALEEIALLTVAVLADNAYGVTVTLEIERQTGRSSRSSGVPIPADVRKAAAPVNRDRLQAAPGKIFSRAAFF